MKSPNLDILRSVAALAVLVDHLMLMLGGPAWVAMPLGRLGVVIFFFHTSLVLMQSLERLSGSGNRFGRVALAFYIRRVARIYPLAMFCVLAVVIARIPAAPFDSPVYEPVGFSRLIQNLLLVQNLTRTLPVSAPLWSLPLEVQMYVILPVIFIWTSSRWLPKMFVAFLSAAGLAWLVNTLTGHLNLLAFVPCFLSGCLAYRLPQFRRQLPAFVWCIGLVALIAWAVDIEDEFGPNFLPVEWGLCFVLALLYRSCKQISTKWIVAPSAWIARYSYGVYLFHVPWIGIIYLRTAWPLWVSAASVVAATLATSWIGFHLLEDPCIKLGAKLSSRLLVPTLYSTTENLANTSQA